MAREIYLLNFGSLDTPGPEDIVLEQLPAIACADDILILEQPARALMSDLDVFVSSDVVVRPYDTDEWTRNSQAISDFISGQREVLMVGATLEQLQSPEVEKSIKESILKGANLNFVIANSAIHNSPHKRDDDLNIALDKLDQLKCFATIFGSSVNIFGISETLPEDFIWVGGWNDMLVRVQNEAGRTQSDNVGIVDYLSVYSNGDREVLGSILTDFFDSFELSEML